MWQKVWLALLKIHSTVESDFFFFKPGIVGLLHGTTFLSNLTLLYQTLVVGNDTY